MRTEATRRAVLAAVAVFAVGASSACTTAVVRGHGAALGGAPSTAVDGFPAVSGPAPDSPSAGVSGRPDPSTTAAATTLPAPGGDGELVTYGASHFQVRMPGKPEKTTEPWSIANYKFVIHIAVVTAPYVALVEGEDVTPSLSPASFDLVLRSAVNGVTSTSGLRVTGQAATTFQGHQARRATLAGSGASFDFLAFVYSGNRIYALLAPTGARFDTLATSFQALP